MTSKHLRRAAGAAAVAALLVGVTASPALAHYIDSQWQLTYYTGTNCVQEATRLHHGSSFPGGLFRGSVRYSTDIISPFNCQVLGVQQTTKHAEYIEIWKWYSAKNAWAICLRSPASDYAYQTSDVFKYTRTFSSPPCGNGWYTLASVGYSSVNGTWRGGAYIALWVYLSQDWEHWLPDSSS